MVAGLANHPQSKHKNSMKIIVLKTVLKITLPFFIGVEPAGIYILKNHFNKDRNLREYCLLFPLRKYLNSQALTSLKFMNIKKASVMKICVEKKVDNNIWFYEDIVKLKSLVK